MLLTVESDELKWKNEWGVIVFYSHGEFNARGVAILIPPEIESNFKYISGHKDNKGHLLIINCKIENNTFILINVYCPTKDDHKSQCQFLNIIKDLFMIMVVET